MTIPLPLDGPSTREALVADLRHQAAQLHALILRLEDRGHKQRGGWVENEAEPDRSTAELHRARLADYETLAALLASLGAPL